MLQQLRNGGSRLVHAFLESVVPPIQDFFFPPLCFSCNGRLTVAESRVCAECWQSMEKVHSNDATVRVLRDRFASEGWIDEFYSCYYFQEGGSFQRLVHSLKYNAVTSIGTELGIQLGRFLRTCIEADAIDLIVPVPLHRLKRRERGFNQSDYLCAGIARVLNRPIEPSLVRRTKYTVSQTHLSAEERIKNVGDAFGIPIKLTPLVHGKTALVVDDVITTGSTIQSVAKVLKEAGAARVVAGSAALAKLGTQPNSLGVKEVE